MHNVVAAADPRVDTDTGHHHLLIRRNDTTGELAYLRSYSPRPATLHTPVTVAGQRWRSWHRWTILAMLAHAFLAVATAAERDTQPTPVGLIALTVNEFRRLFDMLLLTTRRTIKSLLVWSHWRRRHQYRAQLSHYRQQESQRPRTTAAVLGVRMSCRR